MPAFTLETPRLHLRPVSLEDSPAIQKYFANWNIVKYIGSDVPWPYPEDGAKRYLEEILMQVDQSDTYLWGLVLKAMGNEVVGVIEYRLGADEDDNRGFWLAEPFWGRGLMTEAVVATQDFVFNELNIKRLIVKNAESNEGSRKIKIRCGAEMIDRVSGKYLSGDAWEEVWEIRRENWSLLGDHPALSRYRAL